VLGVEPSGVISRFWRAYLERTSDPAASRKDLMAALAARKDFVLPFREEEIVLFRWASQEMPDAWKAKYYLGLSLWAKGRLPEALDAIRDLAPTDDPTFYLSRAWLRRTLASKGEGSDLTAALAQGPALWRPGTL
jgi:hypothetical protein